MSLENSRYAKAKAKEKNPWREVEISEGNLIAALSCLPVKLLKKDEYIERLIVGEPVNGVYPLSVAIVKRKENGDT